METNNFTNRASQLRNDIRNQIKNERVISMVILKEKKIKKKKIFSSSNFSQLMQVSFNFAFEGDSWSRLNHYVERKQMCRSETCFLCFIENIIGAGILVGDVNSGTSFSHKSKAFSWIKCDPLSNCDDHGETLGKMFIKHLEANERLISPACDPSLSPSKYIWKAPTSTKHKIT